MDKDRIAGFAERAKGKMTEAVGKASGDHKLQADDQAKGRMKNATGGLKDTLGGNVTIPAWTRSSSRRVHPDA